jgi:hypothetical protein
MMGALSSALARPSEARFQEAVLAFKRGTSVPEIASRFGVSSAVIYSRLVKVRLIQPGVARQALIDEGRRRAAVAVSLRDAGKTFAEIGVALGVGVERARQLCQKGAAERLLPTRRSSSAAFLPVPVLFVADWPVHDWCARRQENEVRRERGEYMPGEKNRGVPVL